MGKKKIEIKKIDDKDRRMVTFTKRRQGLFKKAARLCKEFSSSKIAIIAFSPAGRPFSFGHDSVDSVLHEYLSRVEDEHSPQQEQENPINIHQQEDDFVVPVPGGGNFWWETLKVEELDSFDKLVAAKNALLQEKENVFRRLQVLTSSLSSSASSITTTITAAVSDQATTTTTSNFEKEELGYFDPTTTTATTSSNLEKEELGYFDPTTTTATTSSNLEKEELDSFDPSTSFASLDNGGEDCFLSSSVGWDYGDFFWNSDYEIPNLMMMMSEDGAGGISTCAETNYLCN